MRYAIVESGIVTNAIEVDPETLDDFVAASGLTLYPHEEASPGWTFDGTTFAPPPIIPEPPKPFTINKRVVVERLHKADLLTQAFAALGGPGAYQYERWSASTVVDPTNADVLALMAGIGADATVILRPGDDV